MTTDISTVLGWSPLHAVWAGAVIGLAGALALRLLWSATPSIRSRCACGTLALMLAAPLATAPGATGLPAAFAPGGAPLARGTGDVQDVPPLAARTGDPRALALLFDLASLAPDVLDAARQMALQVVDADMADRDVMAIVSIADGFEVVADLTSDRDTLRTALLSLEPAATDAPERRWLAPIRTVCDMLGSVRARRAVLLLTVDGGAATTADAGELRDILNACNQANVPIYPVDARGALARSAAPDPAGSPGGQFFTRP